MIATNNDIDRDELLNALQAIDVEGTDHETWVQVGMALKYEGCSFEDFDSWSRNDTRPGEYNAGTCATAWRSFDDDLAEPITGRYIFKLAYEAGWRPTKDASPAKSFGINDKVVFSLKEPGLDASTITFSKDKLDGEPADPAGEVSKFLSALFEPDEYICTMAAKDSIFQGDDGRWRPRGPGMCYKRRIEYTSVLEKEPRYMEIALGTPNTEAGAWVCINPLDGKGRKDENVTAFRYALVESDDMPIEEQLRKLEDLRLPVATIVTSGNKSVHALVRVDAADRAQYRERVIDLYGWLEKNGLSVDRQNANPSRLSRLPGYQRGDHWQRLVQTGPFAKGCKDWAEFDTWRNASKLPPIYDLGSIREMRPIKPELVHGILRDGQKLILSGPSKSGKSFALVELAIAVKRGWKWLGFQCEQGNVLYLNLEIDQGSMEKRFVDAYRKLKDRNDEYIEPGTDDLVLMHELVGIGHWPLRGNGHPLNEMADDIIAQVEATGVQYRLMIIDPIYKVLTGDENSASDMAVLCNQFDRIAEHLGCAVAYAHHHSKAAMNYASSMDRASGSSVFARDPDAILDMSLLQVPDNLEAVVRYNGETCRAYRIEATLREFKEPEPVDVIFNYPLHTVDTTGKLAGCKVGSGKAAQAAGYDWAAIRSTMAVCLDELGTAYDDDVIGWMEEHDGEVPMLIRKNMKNWLKPSSPVHAKFGYKRAERGEIVPELDA